MFISRNASVGNTRDIQLAAGTLTSPMGYLLTSFNNGLMTITGGNGMSSTPAIPNNTFTGIITHTTNLMKVAAQEDKDSDVQNQVQTGEKQQHNVSCLVSDASGCLVR